MEQSRLIIAIALSFLIFFLWEMIMVDKKPPQQNLQKQSEKQNFIENQVKLEEQVLSPSAQIKADRSPSRTDILPERDGARIITVDHSLYTVKISEQGAALKSFVLKKYRENASIDSPFLEMIDPAIESGIAQIGCQNQSIRGLSEALFFADLSSDRLIIDQHDQILSFRWISPEGISIEKSFSFVPDSYLIGLTIKVKNQTNNLLRDYLTISLKKVFSEEKRSVGFSGPCALMNNDLKQIKLDDIEDKNKYTGEFQWIAIQDRYFLSSIIPVTPVQASMNLYLTNNNFVENQIVMPEMVLEPEKEHLFSYQLFFGPKSTALLKTIDYNLSRAINFGMFDVIAKPCVWVMNFLYKLIPNYGIAIIILTLFTKILLWPLGNKSYKSMAEMKRIQPLMAEIREKYKNDKKKMNEEMMGLYRTYKVNPLGGCLPIVVQIPIFFALYRMLYEAIELRHAPFFGWINDLSAPDRLFNFSFSIPFMQPPYGVPVLTIIMGATMFLSQKMQPPMGDPAQAKMMMLMPIVFTVIFINFSSGLVLYWLVNNIVSIAQQYYVTKKNA